MSHLQHAVATVGECQLLQPLHKTQKLTPVSVNMENNMRNMAQTLATKAVGRRHQAEWRHCAEKCQCNRDYCCNFQLHLNGSALMLRSSFAGSCKVSAKTKATTTMHIVIVIVLNDKSSPVTEDAIGKKVGGSTAVVTYATEINCCQW